jgi:hypothetical protein
VIEITVTSLSSRGSWDYSGVGVSLPGYMGCVLANNSGGNTNEGDPVFDLVNLGQNICNTNTICPQPDKKVILLPCQLRGVQRLLRRSGLQLVIRRWRFSDAV